MRAGLPYTCMRTARFFVPMEWLAVTAEAFSIPAGPLYKQIVSVLRMEIGDRISLLPGDGTEYDCRITEITPSAILGVIAGSVISNPLFPEVTVCFGVLKNDHVDLILEKCTELGATTFIPLVTDRTIKKPKDIPPRWRSIVKEASEQSGRTVIPLIREPMTFAQAIGATDGMRRIVLHEPQIIIDGDKRHLSHVPDGGKMPDIAHTDRVALFVGPEGGFTEHEITVARDSSSHVVHLGDLVLRAETAAIVGTTLIRIR